MTNENKEVKIILANAKISYPSLFRKINNPKFPTEESKRKYGCNFLLHKTKHAEKIAEITAALKNICKENKMAYADNKYSIFEDMAIVADADSSKENLRDYFKLSAKSYNKPNVTDINNQPVHDEELVKSGDIVHASIAFMAVPKDRPTLLSCKLNHVKHIRHDTPIITGGVPEDATDKFALLIDDVEPENKSENEVDLF
jgi:hypothetical protein